MSENENEIVPRRDPREDRAKPIECPMCKHKFWHKLGEKLKEAGESVGNAIGEAKFGS
jgi:hypothetical protein